jgi:hypothetical protein
MKGCHVYSRLETSLLRRFRYTSLQAASKKGSDQPSWWDYRSASESHGSLWFSLRRSQATEDSVGPSEAPPFIPVFHAERQTCGFLQSVSSTRREPWT